MNNFSKLGSGNRLPGASGSHMTFRQKPARPASPPASPHTVTPPPPVWEEPTREGPTREEELAHALRRLRIESERRIAELEAEVRALRRRQNEAPKGVSMREGIILSEILGPPRARRAPGTGWRR